MLNKPVTITLGGKERNLRLTLRGMIVFENLTDKSLLKGFSLNDMGLDDQAAIIYACLVSDNPDLTYDEVTDLIDVQNLTEIMPKVAECISQSVSKAKDGKPPLK